MKRYNNSRPEARDKIYIEWRQKIYKRDKRKCVACGSRNKICAHHLDGWSWFILGRYSVHNGVTLCKKCHDKFHKIYGRARVCREQFDTFLRLYYNKRLDQIL